MSAATCAVVGGTTSTRSTRGSRTPVHGDEAIAANFLAGFEGIPSWTEAQGEGYARYRAILERRTPDFQTRRGYPVAGKGRANLAMSTNQLAERFGAVAMTLEATEEDLMATVFAHPTMSEAMPCTLATCVASPMKATSAGSR